MQYVSRHAERAVGKTRSRNATIVHRLDHRERPDAESFRGFGRPQHLDIADAGPPPSNGAYAEHPETVASSSPR